MLEPLIRLLPRNGIFYKARRYIRRAKIPNPERFFSYNLLAENNPNLILQPDFEASVNPECFMDLMRAHFTRIGRVHVTDALLYLDMKITITDNDLRKVTQMAEACGLRVRYPFLHRELVDFAACIPPSLKAKPRKTRVIFKEAMQNFLPPAIIAKKKQGMGLPFGVWLKRGAELSALMMDSLFSPKARISQYLDSSFLREISHRALNDETHYFGDNIWIFLVLELWLRKWTSEPHSTM
jgi:asparagine synthase (glutamine-hydrolysing)